MISLDYLVHSKNKNRKALQLEEDVAPVTEDKSHSSTRDGLTDIEDIAMTLATLCVYSCSQRCDALAARSLGLLRWPLSFLMVLPQCSSDPGDHFCSPTSPPLTGVCRSRVTASPPALNALGPPGCDNKTDAELEDSKDSEEE
jgi:hypothetical protein